MATFQGTPRASHRGLKTNRQEEATAGRPWIWGLPVALPVQDKDTYL